MSAVKMWPVTEKPYAGKLAEERKADRRARLVAAGFELMGTAGAGGTSVRAVCREAGLTSRYFYESFENIDELLVAVFDDVISRTLERVIASLAETDGSVRSVVQALADGFVAVTLDDPHAVRIGFLDAWNSEALMRRRVQTLHDQANLLATVVVAAHDTPPERRQQVAVACFLVVGGLLEAVLGWLDGHLEVDRAALIDGYSASAIAALEAALTES